MAKFCFKCGYPMNGEKFCPRCGAEQYVASAQNFSAQPVQSHHPANGFAVNQKPIKKRTHKKLSKVKIALIAIASTIVVLAIIAAVLFFSGSAYEVLKDFKSQEYSAAVACYEQKVEDDFIQKAFLKIAMKNYGEKIVNDFKDGDLDYDSACEALEALSSMGFGDMSSYLTELTELYESELAYENGNQYYEDGDYENAIIEFSKIPETDERYEEAQSKLNEMYPLYISSVTEQADALISSADYEKALTLLNTALSILPSDIDLTSLNELKEKSLENYKSSVLSNVTALLSEKEYTAALEAIENAIAVDDNSDFQSAKATVEEQYVESITTTVQNYLNNEDYTSAQRAVSNALSVLPDNSDLLALQTKVDNATPIYLLDVCQPYQTPDRYESFVNGEIFMVGGTELTNGFTVPANGDSVIFNVEGQYSSLSFSVGHYADSNYDNVTIKIYLDGNLESTFQMSYEDLAKRVTLDITGVSQIKFQVQADSQTGSSWVSFGFGNVIVK